MRNYIPSWEKIGISKNRYKELSSFCKQYPEWRAAAAAMGHVTGETSQQYQRLIDKMAILHKCASSIDGGAWETALFLNICYGVPHSHLDTHTMPTARRSDYFKARRRFFELLNQMRN